jgi:hypothetical protein
LGLSGGVLYHALFSEHARPPSISSRGVPSVRIARSLPRWVTRAGTLAIVGLMAGCGSNPGTPTPSPSPSPSAQAGGDVAGRYTLQITPAPSCAMARNPLSFPMAAAVGGASPHPGVQVLLDPNGFRLELEALSAGFTLRGGLGTTEEGVAADEGFRLWVHAVGAGPVQRALDGRGEILTGTLAGYLALANLDGFEGALGTCSATDHAFSLRTR